MMTQRILLLLFASIGISFWQNSYSSASSAFQSCDGFNSRLAVGQTVRVITGALNIREQASISADLVSDPLPQGTQVSIVSGPTCTDGFIWWEVSGGNTQGWVAEGNQEQYFLSTPFDPDMRASNIDYILSLLDLEPGAGERFFACEGGFHEDNGVTGRKAFSDGNTQNGSTLILELTTQVLEVDFPAICIDREVNFNGQATAIGPDGQEAQVLMYEYNQRDDGSSRQIQLPTIAYLVGGIWQLEAAGFTLMIDIVLPSHPFAFFTYENNGMLVVGGLQPNERFFISGKPRGNLSASYLEAEADSGGNYQHPLINVPWVEETRPNNLYRTVISINIIGQLGSVYTYRGLVVGDDTSNQHDYIIPLEYSAPLIRDIVWGGNEQASEEMLRAWTCPGGLPIRLGQSNRSAIIDSDVGPQFVYASPSVNAQVERTLAVGDIINVSSGIECADNAVWWRVQDGWIMESQNGQYLLQVSN